MSPDEHWRPTTAHARALVGGLLLSIAAILGRRPDLLVLATPLLGAAVWAAVARPTTPPTVRQRIGHRTLGEGQATTWHVRVDDAEGRVDDVAAVFETAAWIEQEPHRDQVVVDLHHDGDDGLHFAIRSTRWGCRRVGPALVVASSAWGGFRCSLRDEEAAARLVTLPHPAPFDATAPAVRVPGLIGANRSPRSGTGNEFATIRPFQPGDRLRRVHWAQTLRTGTLHVASTWADNDRHVVLLIDALEEVGETEGVDGRSSSLDITVRAAAAIAEHYIGAGDRVGLVVFGARGVQRLPPASGSRHLRRLLEVLATVEPARAMGDDGRVPRGLGDSATVVMLSPVLLPGALQRASTIADRGMSVLVIDCLPDDLADRHPDDPYAAITWRTELLQRERHLRQAREAGIAVVPWRGPGSLDAVMRDLHHRSRSGVRRHR